LYEINPFQLFSRNIAQNMNEKLGDPLVWHSNPEAPLQLGCKIVVVVAVKTSKTSPKSYGL